MLTRRVFIGSTLGGLGFPAATIKGTLAVEKHELGCGDEPHTPGFLKSFQWELAEISYVPKSPNPYIRHVEFPLEDKLHIKYLRKTDNYGGAVEITETWVVWNWQIKGFAFDIVDFIQIPMNQYGIIPGKGGGDIHKIYKGIKFQLSTINCCRTDPFEIPFSTSIRNIKDYK